MPPFEVSIQPGDEVRMICPDCLTTWTTLLLPSECPNCGSIVTTVVVKRPIHIRRKGK